MLRIAVQSKGRLYDETMDLLSEAGIKLTAVKRSLLVPSRNFPVELLFLRDDDIPDSLAVPNSAGYDGLQWFNGKKIATSYPVILSKFFRDNNISAELHEISGSVEIAPSIGLADAIFDIVSSGSTLVSNNLKEVEKVIDSEAVLIGGKALDAEKQEVLDELLFRFEAVKAASGKKYILMNVPRTQLDTVLQILPGIKSPTVLPLADKDWCSVHTVLEEKFFWEIINRLKAAGAEGILVLNIEKMVL